MHARAQSAHRPAPQRHGAIILAAALCATWYHIDRPPLLVDPPQLAYDVAPAIGVYLGALGALLVAAGGVVVDSGREVIARYPDLRSWAGPAAKLPRGPDAEEPAVPRRRPGAPSRGEVVDSTAREI